MASLSAAPSPASSNPKPSSVPAGVRPSKNGNQFPILNLFKVPARVFSPPKGTGMVGSVRSLKATPIGEVTLEDVLANKHLSPLSLKDFEAHLVFREHSAENLYFILWLQEYTRLYAAYQADAKSGHPSPILNINTDPNAYREAKHLPNALSEMLRRGLDAFFSANGTLELNLPAEVRTTTLVDAGNSGDPHDFTAAKDIIEKSLGYSLRIHVKNSVANAGPRRLVFCFSLGLTVFLLGLIAPFVAIFGNHARAWRAIGLPFLMLGSAISIMALRRICAVIWLLGEDRQLLPWELRSPTMCSGSLIALAGPTRPGSVYSDSSSQFSRDDNDKEKGSHMTANSADPYPWEKELAYDRKANETIVDFAPGSPKMSPRPPSYSSKRESRGLVPSSANVWSPVTRVFSPDIAWAQWSIAVTSLLGGLLTMVIVGSVLMAVPNQG